jgi:hypothetical protein
MALFIGIDGRLWAASPADGSRRRTGRHDNEDLVRDNVRLPAIRWRDRRPAPYPRTPIYPALMR